MSTDRYDEATVELVATTLCGGAEAIADGADIEQARTVTRAVLTVLADAGLLLPPGGEKATRVGHWSPHRGYLYECGGHNDECPWPLGGTFVETTWPDGSRHMTGWTEVTDDPA